MQPHRSSRRTASRSASSRTPTGLRLPSLEAHRLPLPRWCMFAGARWGADGTIVYADAARGIFRVDSTGGTPVQVAAAESGVVVVPEVLPDSQWVLYSQSSAPVTGRALLKAVGCDRFDGGTVRDRRVQSRNRERRVILKNGPVSYLSTGHLMYAHGSERRVRQHLSTPCARRSRDRRSGSTFLEQNASSRDVSLNGTLVVRENAPRMSTPYAHVADP